MLTLKDFTKHALENGFYLSHMMADGKEVCLETCLDGFDVAIYDRHQDLIGEKTCTRSGNSDSVSCLIEAINIANKKVSEL